MLSIDVGVKNLSYADVSVLRGNNGEADGGRTTIDVLDWAVLDMTEGDGGAAAANALMRDVDRLSQTVLDRLNERFFWDDVPGRMRDAAPIDCVIVENQPVVKNPTMKTLQVIIYTFFRTVKVLWGGVGDVRFASAASKLDAVFGKQKGRHEKKRWSYADKKRASVDVCNRLLKMAEAETEAKATKGQREETEETEETEGTGKKEGDDNDDDDDEQIRRILERLPAVSFADGMRETFNASRKKDDLADALLQALAFAKKEDEAAADAGKKRAQRERKTRM